MSIVEFDEEHFIHAEISADQLTFDIAQKHGLTVTDLMGKNREPHVFVARLELYQALRDRGWSYPTIARYCGKRDHSTVYKAINRPNLRLVRAK